MSRSMLVTGFMYVALGAGLLGQTPRVIPRPPAQAPGRTAPGRQRGA